MNKKLTYVKSTDKDSIKIMKKLAKQMKLALISLSQK